MPQQHADKWGTLANVGADVAADVGANVALQVLRLLSGVAEVDGLDLSSIRDEQLEGEVKDGPPELLYSHGDHKENLSDFGCNKIESWVISSVTKLSTTHWTTADVAKVAPTANVENVGPLADVSK
ncbi:hypothetical protein AgCh_023061 [Apium graveolens]